MNLADQGRYEEALAVYEQAISLAPQDARNWYSKGVALGRLGRYEEALAAYEQAISLAPHDADNWRGKGASLWYLGRYEEALAAYEQAIRLAPQDASSWLGKGLSLERLDRYEEAVTAYDEALAAGAVFPEAFYYRALALFRLDRWDEAVDALDDAFDRYGEEARAGRDLEVIFQHLLERDTTRRSWPTSITEIVTVFGRHNALAVLGNGLVQAITMLRSTNLDDAARQAWLQVWQESAGNHAEMRVPLRLLTPLCASSTQTTGAPSWNWPSRNGRLCSPCSALRNCQAGGRQPRR